MDLSLVRHLPDLSDVSALQSFADASFQIPVAAGSTSNLLLADDSTDFFSGVDETLNSPAKPSHNNAPLTLEELTPRTRPLRKAPIRSSLRPRPGIPSPLKHVVAHDLSLALGEALSPLKEHDASFSMPTFGKGAKDLLLVEDDDFLRTNKTDDTFSEGASSSSLKAQDPLTLSQLTPGPERTQSRPVISSPSPEPVLHPKGHRMVAMETTGFAEPIDDVALHGGSPTDAVHARTEALISDCPNTTTDTPIIAPTRNKDDTNSHASHVPKHLISKRPYIEKRDKVNTRPKRTVIEGGIKKRTNTKLPMTNLAQGLSKDHKTALLKSRAGDPAKSSIHGRSSSCKSQIISGTSADIHTAPTDMAESGGLAAALMSYGEREVVPANSLFSGVGQSRPKQWEIMSSVEISTPFGLPEAESQQRKELEHQLSESISGQSEEVHCDVDHCRSNTDDVPSHLSHLSPHNLRHNSTISLAPAPKCASHDHQFSNPKQIPLEITRFPPAILKHDPTSSDVPPSPMRPSTKRPISAASSQEEHRSKKEKDGATVDSTSDLKLGHPKSRVTTTRGLSKALQPSRTKNASLTSSRSQFLKGNSSSLQRSKGAWSGLASGSTISKSFSARTEGKRLKEGEQLMASSSNLIPGAADILLNNSDAIVASSSGDLEPVSSLNGDTDTAARHLQKKSQGAQGDSGLVKSSGRLLDVERPVASHPLTKPTRATGFQSRSDARIEARKTEHEERAKSVQRHAARTHATHPIPDFKALHAAQDTVLAARREQIVPLVPAGFEFSTDIRAHERLKFEEARRAREEEVERLAEERRRQRELEEEQEIKELRRRAVPKANEIPEWYANAPKRSQKEGKMDASLSKSG